MIFEVSVFLGILGILGIYRGAIAVNFIVFFVSVNTNFTVSRLRASPYAPDKFYFAKIANWQCSRKFRAYQLKFCRSL